MRNINIPGLSDIPVVGELLFSYNPFVYLGLVIAVLASIYLYKTQVGLNVQAIGENPGAADAAGIEVTKWRYINILLSGAICGIGGAYCSMIINSGVWLRDSVAGLGWISRSARYLCFLEAGECNLRFLYLRSAPGTEILRTEEYVCNPDRILRRAAVLDYGSCPCHLFHEEE